MRSIVEVKNIWAEDLFQWFLQHVLDSCGDGCGIIVCDNFWETADWFIDWFEDNFGEQSYLEQDDAGKELWVSYLEMKEYKDIKKLVK